MKALPALVALLALLLVNVEGLWATSMCSADVDGAVATHAADAGTAPDCAMGHAGHSHGSDEGQDPGGCPLMPAGSSTCVPLFLADAAAEAAPTSSEFRALSGTSDHAKDLLLAVSLLRPPQP